MRTHTCRMRICLALCICLCLSPCIRLLIPASAGSATEDGKSKSFPEGAGKGFPEGTDTTVCTLTAGYALPNSVPNNGEEGGMYIDVPVYLEGTMTGKLAGVLFTVGLPTPWHLSGISPGAGAGGLTLTVRAMAGESDTGAAEQYIVLLDGLGDSTPDATAQDKVLIKLTLMCQAVPEDTAYGKKEKSLLTLAPVEEDAFVYMWTDSGGLVTRPLRGSQTPLPSPGACEYGSKPGSEPDSVPIPESDTGDNAGTDTEDESKTETGDITATETGNKVGTDTDPVSGYPADAICRFRYVGCQEARYGDGLLSVRFLYLVPETESGMATPSVWLTGGGTATLSVSCVTSVAVWSGPSDCHEVAAPPGTRYLILTYAGLNAGYAYLFTLDTGQGLAHVVYEHGVYK